MYEKNHCFNINAVLGCQCFRQPRTLSLPARHTWLFRRNRHDISGFRSGSHSLPVYHPQETEKMTVYVSTDWMLLGYLIIFLLNSLIELPFLYCFFREKSKKLLVRNLLIINGLTHPIAWLILYFPFRSTLFWHYFFLVEAAVVFAEAILIGYLFEIKGTKRPLLVSLLMNTASALVGVLFF